MTIGKIDNEFAVREGWARDSEDEIYMDGYNAFLQITTNDGTSGFAVKNDAGNIAFSAKSDGDGYFAKDLNVENKTTTYSLKVSNGATTGYVLTSDAVGNATWQPINGGGVSPGVLDGYHPDVTGTEHYQQHSDALQQILTALDGYSGGGGSTDLTDIEEALQTILKDLDGYHPDVTGTEHYNQHSEILSTIINDLDGYALASDLAGLNTTVTEHYNQHSQAFQDIIGSLDAYLDDDSALQAQLTAVQNALDGYHPDVTGTEHYQQHSQALQTILSALDGYSGGQSSDLADIEEALQTILKDLDGYHPDVTGTEHYQQHSQAIQTILSDLDGYALQSDLDGLNQTVTEHNNQNNQTFKDIISVLDGYLDDDSALQAQLTAVQNALDGYHPDVTGTEHYNQHSQAFQDILSALDGYSGGGGSTDLTDIEEALQTILKDLDGYISGINVEDSGSSVASDVTTLNFSANLTVTDNGSGKVTIDAAGAGGLPPGTLDGYLDEDEHRDLDQLVHDISENSYDEFFYTNFHRIRRVITWTDMTKTTKIRERIITYINPVKINKIVTIQYNAAGVEVERETETYSYSGLRITGVERTLT